MSHSTTDHRQGKPPHEGFVMIPENICDALARTKLSPSQSRVLWAVLRKTWRYQKDADWVSDTQLAAIADMDRTQVNKAKQSLVKKRILFRDGSKIGVNRNWPEWCMSKVACVSEPANPCAETDNKSVSELTAKCATSATHNRRETKDSLIRGATEREKELRTFLLQEMGMEDFAGSLREQQLILHEFLALVEQDGNEKFGRKWRRVKTLDHFHDIRSLQTLYSLYKSSPL